MKKLIALEEAAQFVFTLFILKLLFIPLHAWYILIFFLPDFFAIGYFISPRAGSILYNFSHHKALALALIAAGIIWKQQDCLLFGLLFYSHSSFDRMLGYGLKFQDSPNHTHLGYIGKEKHRNSQG